MPHIINRFTIASQLMRISTQKVDLEMPLERHNKTRKSLARYTGISIWRNDVCKLECKTAPTKYAFFTSVSTFRIKRNTRGMLYRHRIQINIVSSFQKIYDKYENSMRILMII